jgi:thiol-disulfide isomerase/thioredoxin
MMKPVQKLSRMGAKIVIFTMICALLLSACRRAPEPTPTPSAATAAPTATNTLQPTVKPSATEAIETPTPTMELSPYPEAVTAQPSPGVPAATAYPGPPTPFPSPTSPYPGPPTPFPSPTSPYPGPATPFPSPTSPYPVPSPGLPISPSSTPYPVPGSRPDYPAPGVTPTAIPGAQISPSPPAAGISPTPLPTLTPGVVRTRLRATDPRTFQIVSGQHQLVEFFAFWDPVSRSMAPVVHGLEDRYKDRIRFVYLDIDDPANSLFKSLIGSRLPPLFFLLDGQGNILQEWRGYVTTEDFERAFSTIGP